MNFIVQIIVLSGPSKPGNTDSVSQSFKKIREACIPGFPHFRVCFPHFLERIVALVEYIMNCGMMYFVNLSSLQNTSSHSSLCILLSLYNTIRITFAEKIISVWAD